MLFVIRRNRGICYAYADRNTDELAHSYDDYHSGISWTGAFWGRHHSKMEFPDVKKRVFPARFVLGKS